VAQIDKKPIAQQAAAQIQQTPLSQLPWFHHCVLLDKLESAEDRLWYASKAVENGWSRNMLEIQIENNLHKRHGRAITNFHHTLPPAQSDLAQAMTKDPYIFDFLTLTQDANERALELGLMAQVEKFLLELGAGFSLVGRQVKLEVDGEEFFIDLLFYHLELRCFVVIELKTGKFTPEVAGKMNFYLSAVDSKFRKQGDAPSIGLILCRSKSRIIAEYALRDVRKPVGVADYATRLVEKLPSTLKGAVPTVKELEEGLSDSSNS
jgi:predicted nuclease of restriction endonuclease-like (RecB) superfamily